VHVASLQPLTRTNTSPGTRGAVVGHGEPRSRIGRCWSTASSSTATTICTPTRAELLRRLDRIEDARAAYDRALELIHSDAERRFLERRLAELHG
jgi:hypothetical protein